MRSITLFFGPSSLNIATESCLFLNRQAELAVSIITFVNSHIYERLMKVKFDIDALKICSD